MSTALSLAAALILHGTVDIVVIVSMDPKDLPSTSDIAQGFRLLAVETRLEILLTLRSQTLCVGALANRLGLTQGAVSQHLKMLRDAGLLIACRDGHFVHYRVNEATLRAWQIQICNLFEPHDGPSCTCRTVQRDSPLGSPCTQRQEGFPV